MTRRGHPDRGAGPLSVREPARAKFIARGRAGRPHHRRHALGVLVEAQPAVHALARRLRQLQPRLRRHLPRRLRRSHRGDVAKDAAGGSRAQSRAYGPLTVLARVQSFQTLQDPNPAAAVTPPYNMLPQVKAVLNEYRLARSHLERTRRVRRASRSPRCVPTGDRATFYPSLRWIRQGNAWFVNARAGDRRVAIRSQPADARRSRRQRGRCGADRERRRRAHLRARLVDLRHATSCRRSSRARCTPTSRSATRTSCRCSTPCWTTSTSRSSSARTASSAATASATPTSSRSP